MAYIVDAEMDKQLYVCVVIQYMAHVHGITYTNWNDISLAIATVVMTKLRATQRYVGLFVYLHSA